MLSGIFFASCQRASNNWHIRITGTEGIAANTRTLTSEQCNQVGKEHSSCHSSCDESSSDHISHFAYGVPHNHTTQSFFFPPSFDQTLWPSDMRDTANGKNLRTGAFQSQLCCSCCSSGGALLQLCCRSVAATVSNVRSISFRIFVLILQHPAVLSLSLPPSLPSLSLWRTVASMCDVCVCVCE